MLATGAMTTMTTEIYDLLRAVEVPEERARAIASSLSIEKLATRADLEQAEQRLRAETRHVEERLSDKIDQVDQRLSGRIGQLAEQLATIKVLLGLVAAGMVAQMLQIYFAVR